MNWSPFRQVLDLRPSIAASIIGADIHLGSASEFIEHRIAVLWDEDEDERVFDALAHIYYAAPRTFEKISAIGERKASLTVWLADASAADLDAVQAAAECEAIHDAWSFEVRELVYHAGYPSPHVGISNVHDGRLAAKPPAAPLPLSQQDLLLGHLNSLIPLGWWGARNAVK